jgi:amino acid transporter
VVQSAQDSRRPVDTTDVFAFIGAGVASGLIGLIYFGLSGQADYPGAPPGPTTWPIGLVLVIVAVIALRIGLRGLRYMSGGQAFVHLALGGILGFVIVAAPVTGGFG